MARQHVVGGPVFWRNGERGFVLAAANRVSQRSEVTGCELPTPNFCLRAPSSKLQAPGMELATTIDLALSCARARGSGGACAGGFSVPDRVDPIIRRYLSWTVLGQRALERRG